MSDDRLDRLNDAERAVLWLLAEGHTAKSAATALDSSEPAVNERLREARRKTGFGSSRELARAVVAQENRDREIGGAVPGEAGQIRAGPRVGRGRLLVGAVVMMSLAFVSAAVILLSNDAVVTRVPVDPFAAAALRPDADDPHRLYQQVRSELRDDLWASGVEATLAERYLQVGGVGTAEAPLRVLCAASLRDVTGRLTAGTHPNEAVALVSKMEPELKLLGLLPVSVSFGRHTAGPTFIGYLRRNELP